MENLETHVTLGTRNTKKTNKKQKNTTQKTKKIFDIKLDDILFGFLYKMSVMKIGNSRRPHQRT